MKRARPKNKKAAQRLMRQREIEYLKRQKEEYDNEQDDLDSSIPLEEVSDLPEYEHQDVIDSVASDIDHIEDFQNEDATPDGNPDEDVYVEEEDTLDEEQVDDETEPDDILDTDEEDAVDSGEHDEEQVDEEDPGEDILKERTPTDIDLDFPKKTKKRKSVAKSIFKVLVGAMLVLVVLIFVTLGFGLFDDTQILAPLEDGKINVLLMGVDESGLRTDAVMVCSYNVNEGKINMLSIPRDTKIYIENRRMTRKMNEIHALSSNDDSGRILGTQAMAETVTALTGIPINYYVEFSFASIDHLFDILGPVEYDVPDVEGNGRGMNYDDPYQNLHIHIKPGLQKLSGNQIQQFLRYRKSNSGVGTGSDTDRVIRQQEFVKAVIDQKVNLTTILKLPSIFSQLSREIRTNISLNDITKYIRYVNKLSGEGVMSYSLPGEAKTVGGGSYFVCNLEETATFMRDVFGVEEEISDKVTLSETNPQKPLKVAYVTATPEPTKEPNSELLEKTTDKPTKEPVPSVTKEPTKAPVVTKEPTKAPVVTKEPEDEIIILE